VLDGGPGVDRLDGNSHSDTCIGGTGFDTFVNCETVDDDPAPADCGDGSCDPGEDSCSCETDCGAPAKSP